jgi:hypothetical protein
MNLNLNPSHSERNPLLKIKEMGFLIQMLYNVI